MPTQEAFSQDRKYESLDLDRVGGGIRDKQHAYSQDGGLAVLCGNVASSSAARGSKSTWS